MIYIFNIQILTQQISNQVLHGSVRFVGKKTKWFRPITMEELLELKSVYSESQILVGNTEVGELTD